IAELELKLKTKQAMTFSNGLYYKQLESDKKNEQAALDKLNTAKSELQKAETLNGEFSKREQAESALKLHLEHADSIKARQQQLENAKNANKIELPYISLQNAKAQTQELRQKIVALEESLEKANVVAREQENLQQSAKKAAAKVPQLTQLQYQLESMKNKLVEKDNLESKITAGYQQKQQFEATLKQYIELKDKLTLQAQQGQKELEKARVDVALIGSIDAEIKQKQRLLQDLK
ncbi:SMC family ATPase, partial [Vibrio parahaemolyticus]|nr:SMC family ATPase [Vibrio parahaemolyticus]